MVTRNNQRLGISGDGKLAAEDLLQTFGPQSKTRVFVSPGKDVLELLMRTVFESKEQAVAAVLLFDKCQRFNFKRGLEDLKAYLASMCSIRGRSTEMALMAETGVVAPGILAKNVTDMRTLKKKGAQPKDETAAE